MLVMLLLCSTNTQSFVHNKSSSTSQIIKGKSSDLQRLLRYLSGMVISMFKVASGGRAGWWACPSFPDCDGLSGVFPVIFVLYLNHLLFEALSLT